MSKNKIELGDLAKDSITGYTGIVIGFTKHITGCDRFIIQPKIGSDGKLPEAYSFDVTTCELIQKSVVKVELPKLPEPEIKPGGPATKSSTFK